MASKMRPFLSSCIIPITNVRFTVYIKVYELTSEARDFLNKVGGPIGVITVAGMYRTGKSYLLNRMLLNRSSGFGVGPTINPCTKGMWVWGRPIQGTTPEGEPLQVLIMDTEGLGALDEDSNHDVRIFSLAILLSSYFLYNSVGSIDESALSNLSLVVNLTRNIHLKSNSNSDDIDTEEYSNHFPTFMWVVRDFTLQLVDQEGEPISSKDYFESALTLSKGFSDSVEQKNRIRRLLKSFFKDRDCQTMIRPLTNEDNLQTLEEMDLSELRAEFVEQVMQLRRKVLNRVKPKQLNGKNLTGAMLATLSDNYIRAINGGAVPNIENAWSYICKTECQKAFEKAIENYEEILSTKGYQRIPLEEDELKDLQNEAKKDSIALFNKIAIGDNNKEALSELKEKIKFKYQDLKEENEREAGGICSNFLIESYQILDSKLKNKEFPSFSEYELELKQLQAYYMEQGPPGPQRHLIMLEFIQNVMAEAASYFNQSLQNELHLQCQISKDQICSLQSNLKEQKQELIRDKETIEHRLQRQETQNAELQALEQSLKDQLQAQQIETDATLRSKDVEVDGFKRELKRQEETFQSKLENVEGQAQSSVRRLRETESEHEKEKALVDQKVMYLEEQLADKAKREELYLTESKTNKKELQTETREMQQKFEEQVRFVAQEKNDLEEQYNDVYAQFQELTQKYDCEKSHWVKEEAHLKTNMSQSKATSSELQKVTDSLKSKHRVEIEKLQQDLLSATEQTGQQMQDLETQLLEKSEEMKSIKLMTTKQEAIWAQKIEFNEVQYQQTKKALDEQKRQNENLLSVISDKDTNGSSDKEQAFKQCEDLKLTHQAEVSQFESELQILKSEIEIQKSKQEEVVTEIEGTMQIKVEQVENEKFSLKQQIEDLQSQLDNQNSQIGEFNSQRFSLIEDQQDKYRLRVDELELELEKEKSTNEKEVRDISDRSEEQIAQLRNSFEMQKQMLEERLHKEKESAKRKINNQTEEYDQRLKDEQNRYEEDLEMLQEELKDKEMRNQSILSQAEQENALLVQKVETLLKQLKDKEEQLMREQNLSQNNSDQVNDRIAKERREFADKFESQNKLLTEKDREIAILKNRSEQTISELEKKTSILDEIKSEQAEEKQRLTEKIETLSEKHNNAIDELMQRKLDYGREKALTEQQISFKQQRIDDLQTQLNDSTHRYEERLTLQKKELSTEMTEKIQRVTEEQQIQSSKYDQKRKAFKEIEHQLQKEQASLEKERAVLQEKLTHEANKMSEMENRQRQELEQQEEQLMQQIDQISKERDYHYTELQRIKQLHQETEKEYNEIMSSYDKDKALWENQVKFLESQKEQAKQEQVETQKKLMSTLEQLQKRQNNDSGKGSDNPIKAALEAKVREQLKEKQEQLSVLKQESSDSIRLIEKEKRELDSKCLMLEREKKQLQEGLDKRIADIQEKDKKYQNDIATYKAEREKRLMDAQKQQDKDKDSFKQKIKDLEEKNKELENKRHEQIFAIENERTKFNMERDMLAAQKQELIEKTESLEKKKEQLMKENATLAHKNKQRPGAGGRDWNSRPMAGADFASHLLKQSYVQKENGTSQNFAQGFFKFSNPNREISTTSSEMKEPMTLPMQTQDANKQAFPNTTTPNLGSPVPQRSMGSTDETGSNF